MSGVLLVALIGSFMLVVQAGFLDQLNLGAIEPPRLGGCPNYDLIPVGCAYQPKCGGFGPSCPVGHTCCAHPCGDRCILTVKCDAIDCGEQICAHGFQTDSRGCQTCDCKSQPTAPICNSLACILGNKL